MALTTEHSATNKNQLKEKWTSGIWEGGAFINSLKFVLKISFNMYPSILIGIKIPLTCIQAY